MSDKSLIGYELSLDNIAYLETIKIILRCRTLSSIESLRLAEQLGKIIQDSKENPIYI